MDHAVLVDIEVRTGSDFLAAIAETGRQFPVALWATLPDYYDPRLILAAPWLDADSITLRYHALNDAIAESNFSVCREPVSLPMRMDDPFIKDLRDRFAGEDVEGLRLRGRVGQHYVEDGYVNFVK